MSMSLLAGSEISLNTTIAADQIQPAVAVLADGSQLVAWASNGQDGNGYGIYAQRVDSEGRPIGGEFRVNSSTTYNQVAPSVASLGNGGFMVVWSQNAENASTGSPTIDGQLTAIRAQRYDIDGNSMGGEMTLATSGGALAVWHTGGVIYGQRFNTNGASSTGVFAVAPYEVGGEAPNVTALSNGGYVVSWTSFVNLQDNTWDILTKVYSASNGVIAGPSAVSAATHSQRQSAVAGLTGGGYVVVSTSAEQDGSGYGVYAQRYDSAGRVVGSNFLLDEISSGNQIQPTLVSRPDGGFAAAWTGPDGAGYGVKLREFPPSPSAPVFETEALHLKAGEAVLAATLFRPGHLQGDELATAGLQRVVVYEFEQTGTGIGHFELDGVAQPAGQPIALTTEQLSHLKFIGGTGAGTDSIRIRAWDGTLWSDWSVATAETVLPSVVKLAGPETRVNTTTASHQIQPAITILPNGTQVVVWASNAQDGNGYGVYAQRLDTNGQPLGGEFRVNTSTALNQDSPSVTALGNGGFMIAWREYLNTGDANQTAVYVQRYDAAGNAVGSAAFTWRGTCQRL